MSPLFEVGALVSTSAVYMSSLRCAECCSMVRTQDLRGRLQRDNVKCSEDMHRFQTFHMPMQVVASASFLIWAYRRSVLDIERDA